MTLPNKPQPFAGLARGLVDAYRATTYAADTPLGPVRLRIGANDERLDRLLRDRGVTAWVYVTAWNPRSQPTAEAENQRRNEQLRGAVAARRLACFEGVGRDEDLDRPGEASLLVLGIGRAEALSLGRRFGQNAVVFGEIGGPAELLDCRRGGACGRRANA